MTKLGLHVNRIPSPLVAFVRETKPRIVKFLDHDVGTVRACREASPETLLIGRVFTGDQRYDQPAQNARTLVEKILPVAERIGPLYEAWESYNELEPQNPDEAKRFSEFHVHFAERMHAHGLKTIAYNFSTGVPKLALWPFYQDGAAASDYIGLHEYDAPSMDRLHKESLAKGEGGMFLCLRYRRVWDLLEPRARKPIIITECGIDGGVINDTFINEDGDRVKKMGYRDFRRFNQISTEDYMQQLAWYDSELMKDDYIVGACIFCFGADTSRWEPFDVGTDDEARAALRNLLLRRHALPQEMHVEAQPATDIRPPAPIDPSQPGPVTPLPPSPAPTPQPSPPEPQRPPSPMPQPSPEPPPPPIITPESRVPAAPWLAARYNDDANLRDALGQASAPAQEAGMAEQPFERGAMIYRGDTRQIYALHADGTWQVFADSWNSDQPEGGFVRAPDGLIEPKRGFGKVWREQLGGANAAIGFATEGERGFTGAVQSFERGLAIFNGRDARVLGTNGRWQ